MSCNKTCKIWYELADFRLHLLNAEKEVLLAAKSLLDKAINRVEKAKPTPQKSAQKVEIK
jgi:hypothetical protein